LDRTYKRSFIVVGLSPERFLISVFFASEKFDYDLELDAGMHKTDAHPCTPINNNIAPMPTQNPWAWMGMDGHGHGWTWMGMGMGMGTQCRAPVHKYPINEGHFTHEPRAVTMTMKSVRAQKK
jgi:hypothetical protein